MEEKVLFNVLKSISRDKTPGNSAPDSSYVKALAQIGLVDDGWDTTLTSLGRSTLEWLRNRNEKW